MIWASSGKGAKYTFNYQAMKGLNDEKQMRSDWWLYSLATGSERVKDSKGGKAHSTQKPEALLYRVILSSSNPGDVVLDPFLGSGTTGAVAKKLHRNWIGLEREAKYIKIAQKRIDKIQPEPFDEQAFNVKRKSTPRVAFSTLLENGYLAAGQKLFFAKDKSRSATIKPDARIRAADGFEGSIHRAGSHYMDGAPCNGWEHWYLRENGSLISLDVIRQKYRMETGLSDEQPD
jgi:modification methylase